MKIAVTGAAGFIGAPLVRRLLRDGHQVRAVVRSSGSPSARAADANLEMVAAGALETISDFIPITEGCDAVLHLAARVHLPGGATAAGAAQFSAMNAGVTERLLRAAEQTGVSHFLFFSTVAVHGESSERPLTESDPPDPRSAYARSKWEAEEIVRRASSIGTTIIRPPSVYGAGVRAKFRALLRAIDRGIPLPFGGVKNARSFLFVENLVDAAVQLIGCPNAIGEAFLVADEETISTPELVRRIAERLERTPRLFRLPPPVLHGLRRLAPGALRGSMESFSVDATKIRTRIGWTPPHTFDEGLDATVRWYLSNLG